MSNYHCLLSFQLKSCIWKSQLIALKTRRLIYDLLCSLNFVLFSFCCHRAYAHDFIYLVACLHSVGLTLEAHLHLHLLKWDSTVCMYLLVRTRWLSQWSMVWFIGFAWNCFPSPAQMVQTEKARSSSREKSYNVPVSLIYIKYDEQEGFRQLWHIFLERSPSSNLIWDTVKLIPPSIILFLPLIRPLVAKILLFFRLCLFNLLVKFVTWRIQQECHLVQQCYPQDNAVL